MFPLLPEGATDYDHDPVGSHTQSKYATYRVTHADFEQEEIL